MIKEKTLFFFFFLEGKIILPVSFYLNAFFFFFFFGDVGKFGVLHGASIFQTGNCLL